MVYLDYDVQAITLGGVDRQGNCGVNDMSYLILEATRNVEFIRDVSIRVSKKSPPRFLRLAAELIAEGGGIPFLFNDDCFVKALSDRGIAIEDARDYAPIGCIELTIPGKANPHAVSGWLNTAKCLELALFDGADPRSGVQLGPKTGLLGDHPAFESLLAAYDTQVEFFARRMVYHCNRGELLQRERGPLPCWSIMTDDCIARGRDITDGGAVYNYHSICLLGTANTADSLMAVKKLVYDEKQLGAAELLDALRTDFAGKEELRQLFVNGQRAIRARTPNADDKTPWWKMKTAAVNPGAPNPNSQLITVSVDHPIQAWKNAADVELIYLNNNDASRKRVGVVDEAAQTFTLPPPHQWPPAVSAQTGSHPAPGIACYLENAPEMLDQPGEWYLDRTTGVLAYWPRPGENLKEAEVIAPVVQNTLLAVTGVAGKPVRNLHFKGIHVDHVDWPLPSYGFALMFGCLQVTTEQPKFYWIDAAVSFKHARACNFTDGGVAHAGGIGIGLLSGCAQNVIEGNQVYDLGGGGIVAGGIHPRDGLWKWADPIALDDHLGYRIANNTIHHCGTDYFGAIGIFLGLTQEAVVAHNLIHDIAYCGIVLSGNSTPLKLARNNTVEYNHIHDVLQTAVDGGGIYLSFPHEGWGAVIRGNFVHDIGYRRDGTANGNADQGLKRWGLALDDVTPELRLKNYKFVSNVICDVSGGAVTAVYEPHKTDLTWIDNTFTDGSVPRELFDAMQTRAGLEPAYRRMAPSSLDVKGVMKEGKEKVLRADHFACFFCDVKAVMKERKEKSGGASPTKP